MLNPFIYAPTVIRKVIKATTRANHLTSLPLPLSGIKGTIKAQMIGNKIDKDNHGIVVRSAPNNPKGVLSKLFIER